MDVGDGGAVTGGLGVAVSAPFVPPVSAYAPTGTATSVTSAAPTAATRRRRSTVPRCRIAGYGTGDGWTA
ncbi:hypothetical protein [Streptomyces sp. TRM72054]|uniref:hypothetical protein n=1 Tax=Streptomyces sp. TRM72054 TaxID=2870562 RepID=UPI0027DEC343|nr:hypothetical protein [Streptomyces sp. TRM72054]